MSSVEPGMNRHPENEIMGTEIMDEFCACKKGFQTASGVFAQALLTQSVVITACVLIGFAVV